MQAFRYAHSKCKYHMKRHKFSGEFIGEYAVINLNDKYIFSPIFFIFWDDLNSRVSSEGRLGLPSFILDRLIAAPSN